jgi:hypothetical protein
VKELRVITPRNGGSGGGYASKKGEHQQGQKVKMIDELEPQQKSHILGVIDMAVNNKRLKDTLSNALSLAQ